MLHTSSGIGLPGGIATVRDRGVDAMVSPSPAVSVGDGRRLRLLSGLLGGLGAEDSVSEEVSGGVGNECGKEW